MAKKSDYDIIDVDHWEVPENPVEIIAMPNIPLPLHNCNPRNLLGSRTWDLMRKTCYRKAHDTCEICGHKPEDLRARHCLERGTEVLTSKGWRPIEQITTEDTVAGFNPNTGMVVWEQPTSTTSHFEKNIYRFGYENGKGFSIGVSSRHRMLLQDGKSKAYETVLAKDMRVGVWKNIPSAGKGEGEDHLTADERLLIALQADGTVQKSQSETCYCKIRVKKKRKIERLKKLAEETSYATHQGVYGNEKYFRLSFSIPYKDKNFFDTFKTPKMSYAKANEFIDELVKWDGWEGDRNGYAGRCYYTSVKENIEFVQAVCAQAGLGSHLTTTYRKMRDFGDYASTNLKPAYSLEIKKRSFYGVQTMSKSIEEYNDDVFCISIPSSYFVARTKGGDVFITGNSHEVYDIDYKNHTATFKRCVCVCKRCHLLCIHTGRALTLFKHNNAVFTADKLIEGAEHAFTIISSFNGGRQGEPPLRAFSTWLEYLKEPELKPRMEELIKKYDIKFYDIPSKSFNKANWSKWKLIIGDREYPTPFKNQADWEEKMAENNKKGDREAVDNFKGGIFDEINEILKNNID